MKIQYIILILPRYKLTSRYKQGIQLKLKLLLLAITSARYLYASTVHHPRRDEKWMSPGWKWSIYLSIYLSIYHYLRNKRPLVMTSPIFLTKVCYPTGNTYKVSFEFFKIFHEMIDSLFLRWKYLYSYTYIYTYIYIVLNYVFLFEFIKFN